MHTSQETMKSVARLLKRADFLCVQASGKKWVSKSLVLQIADNPSGTTRFGLTVTKKVSKSAVVRNRIRRRLRAAAYDVIPVHSSPGHDYVLIGREETATRPYEDLTKDLEWCIKRLNALKNQGES
jgi:ribonuclease P protein component